ncbi:hypothetical protein [Runella zeae]|uniref:hypothetical protein n=1 Tax=Runella zeae TaxID=94255 RepID=UPI0023525137|nr:hypothetical protein [Runella zeae]
MDLREQAVIDLRLETKQANTEMTALETKSKALQKQLKDVAKTVGEGSEEWKKVKKQVDETDKAIATHRKNVDITQLTYGQLQNHVKHLNAEVKSLTPGTNAFNAAVGRLKTAETQLQKVQQQVKGTNTALQETSKPTLWNNFSGGVGKVSAAFNAFIALQIVQFIVGVGKAIFDITAKFEKYEKVLTTALGSEKLAKQSMEAIKVMAANTSFSVDELTEGYVKMVNRGLRPSQKEMIALADLASSQGKTFDQLVEAVLDAQGAEFERLKEFGIKAKKEGDNISLTFKGQTQVVKNNEEAIYKAMIAMGAMTGVAGQNAKMMETLGGKTSNLGDNFDAMMVTLGDGLRPVFIAILDLLNASIPVLTIVGKAIGSVILVAKSLVVGLVDTVKNAGLALYSLGDAAAKLVQGNLTGAKKALDESVTYGTKTITSMKTNINQGIDEVVQMWKDPGAGVAAEFAGKSQGQKYAKAKSEEDKKAKDAAKKAEEKHLEEVKKANEDAIKKIGELEAEAHLRTITDELTRERVAITQKYDLKKEEVMNSLASEANKNSQIKLLHSQMIAEVSAKEADYRDKKAKAEAEAATKRAEANKFIQEQEKAAEMALLDFKEVQAKGNATKLAAIKKERLETELRFLKEKIDAEEVADKAEAARKITDTTQRAAAIKAIEDQHRAERLTAETNTAAQIKEVEEQLKQARTAKWTEGSNAIKALLQGDLNGFVQHASNIVQGEKQAWQTRLAENTEKYEAVGQLALASVSFLKQLSEERLNKELANIEKEKTTKIAASQAETQAILADIEAQQNAELDRVEQELLANNLEKAELTRLNTAFTNAKQKMELEYQAAIKEARDLGNEEEMERLKAERDEKLATVKANIMQEQLGADKAKAIEDKLTTQKKSINDKYNASILSAKKKQEANIDAINKDSMNKEKEAKLKNFRNQKKADIAAALISGALATIKALASGMFPLNLVFAALTAVATGLQVAKIKNQPEPQFASGGFFQNAGVLRGSKHSEGGIDMIDSRSGKKVAEVENNEAYIVSSPVTDYHRETLDEIIDQSQKGRPAPLRRKKYYQNGGAFKPEGERPFWEKNFFGKGKKAKKAAEAAAAEAAAAEASGGGSEFDASGYDTGGANVEGIDDAKAQGEKAREQGEKQLKLLEEIARNTKDTTSATKFVIMGLGETANSVKAVESAVRDSNQSGRLDALIGAISSLGSK